MHVAIDATTTQSKAFAGIGQYSKNLIAELVRSSTDDDKFTLLLYEGQTTLPTEVIEADNVQVIRIGNMPGGVSSLFTYWRMIRPAIEYLMKTDSDTIYFCPYFLHGFPTSELKCVLAVHDFAMPFFDYYSDKGKVTNYIRKNEFWYHMDRSVGVDAIVADSLYTKKDYMGYYPDFDQNKIYPIPLGVEMEEIEDVSIDKYLPDDWEEKGYYVYMGGGIQKSKNTEGVILGYANFIDRWTEKNKKGMEDAPYLVIAGKIFLNDKAPQSVEIHRMIKELDLDEKVHFSGFYEDGAKYKLLSSSITFIHLSLFEGFGIAVAEAMRAKKAVIVHNGTSYPEVVGDTGYLVEGDDPEEVGEVMLKVLDDPKEAERLGKKAYERSMQLTWENCAKGTWEVFNKVNKMKN